VSVAVAPTFTRSNAPPPGLPPEPELILRRLRLLARLRSGWLERVRATGTALVEDADTPEDEAVWRQAQSAHDEVGAIEQALRAGAGARLSRLVATFGLSEAESDVLQAALALALDPSLAPVYAHLHHHPARGYLSAPLAARLFGHGRTPSLGPESPLFRWELLTEREVAPGEPDVIACDPQVCGWYLDRPELDRSLVGIARLREPLAPLAAWPVEGLARTIDRGLRAEPPARLRLVVRGPGGSGRRTLAACVAARLGLPVLAIDADAIEDADWPRVYMRAQRQAFLDRCALAWHGESLARRAWPVRVPPFPLQFVVVEPGQPVAASEDTDDYAIDMPPVPLAERRELWRQYLPPAPAPWGAEQLDAVARRFRATPGDIARAARRAGGGVAEVEASLRGASRERLGELAQLLECPFDWEDLVVPPPVREALDSFAFEARVRGAFWERPEARRLFPQGRGLLALFSGPPGTGKTMAAQVVAARLGLQLFRVNAASIVSKWVGEGARNLETLLGRARAMDIVLLFDEADAIWGKRIDEVKDAQDRFANHDVSHLMVAIEAYDGGPVILASNLKGNIDPAFLRRIRYSVDFPKPAAAERLAIWTSVLGALLGAGRAAALAPSLKRLAQVEATGAQIKYGALAAVFLAEQAGAPLGMTHLVRGLNRELAKEGAALNQRAAEALLHER
jgi:MoxR-like ATPase